MGTIVERLRAAGCVFAEDEAALLIGEAADAAELESMVLRRVEGHPLEHILGWAEFRGLRITVDENVFVPRQRTGFVVELALRALAAAAEPTAGRPVVLDLCCGAGAIGAAIAREYPGAEGVALWAADIDPAAVASARRNIPSPGVVLEGDLFDPLPADLRGRIGVIAVNAPYVPTEAIALMPPEARLHEAPVALDGGADGLDVQRRVVAEAPRWLAPGGHLLIETSERQAPHTAALFLAAGLATTIQRDDERDATVVVGRATAT